MLSEQECEKLLSKKSMSLSEIKACLEKEPETIIYLYKKLNSTKFKWEQCEELSGFLLEHFDYFDNIPVNLAYAGLAPNVAQGWRYLSYRNNSRKGYPSKGIPPKAQAEAVIESEKLLAMHIFRQGRAEKDLAHPEYIDKLGYVLDYEMPIGGTKTLLLVNDGQCYYKEDKTYPFGIHVPQFSDCLFEPGKCDLVVYDKRNFIILELKKKDNKEPLLRAVLEAYTYLKMLDKKRAAKSLTDYYPDIISPTNASEWIAAPLLYLGGAQHKEYLDENNVNLRLLMRKLNIDPIWYHITNDDTIVID